MNACSIIQLNPYIPVVTADGKGEAVGWIDYGKDDDLLWIVFLQKNGTCWIYPNPQIRACPNITFGRMPHVSAKDLSKFVSARTTKKTTKKKRAGLPLKNVSSNGNGFHLPKEGRKRR
jgi:hypothetical protein